MEEQKIKQDIRIGANIRRIRKNRGIKPMALVRLLQLEGVEITRESLVKIERGAQHIKASQLSAPSAAVFWTDRASVTPVAGSFPGRREPTPCAGGPAAFSARRLCGTRAWPERGSTASSSGGCPLLRRPWES